jgi:hypothetical protein
MVLRTGIPIVAVALGLTGCGSPAAPKEVPVPAPVAGIPLTRRPHMNAATQAVYDRIRSSPGWLLGVGEIGTAANAFFTVAESQVEARWTELYGTGAGVPASIDWEMGEANQRTVTRDWASLAAFAAAGGLPWLHISMNNFSVPFGPGQPPAGGMNDTRGRAAAVLAQGEARDSFTSYIRNFAREVNAVGAPVILRPLNEGNGMWFWWGGHAADYRTLWRQVFDIFQQEGVRNVIWMWAAADTCTVQCNIAGFYPGDDVVDILGLNAYFTAPALPASARTAFGILAGLGLDKPVMFGEIGPQANAAFWSRAATDFATIPRFRGFSLWFARGWQVWGGSPGVGSMIDGSTPAAVRQAFDGFLRDERIVHLARWVGSASQGHQPQRLMSEPAAVGRSP